MIRRTALAVAAVALMAPSFAHANAFFTEQAASSTGAFEWDKFDVLGEIGFAGPHAPDVRSTGVGSAAISATATSFGMPPAAVTSTNNLYTGMGIGTFTANLTGAQTTAAQSTLVLQVSAFGALSSSSFLLDGTVAPTEFVDRGIAANGANYYWAEWQAPAAAAYSVVFKGAGPHLSVSGAQLDYFNETFNAVAAPAFVPEPTAGLLAGFGMVMFGIAKRRQR